MIKGEYKCLIISDFTIDNLAGYLNKDGYIPRVKSIVAPFDQVTNVLVDDDLECWKSNPDLAVVWTRPDRAIEAFNYVLGYGQISLNRIYDEVDKYSCLLLNILDRVEYVFVPLWVLPSYHKGAGMLDMKNGIGVENTLMRMNLRLSEALVKRSNIYLLNTRKWIEIAGKHAFNPKWWRTPAD